MPEPSAPLLSGIRQALATGRGLAPEEVTLRVLDVEERPRARLWSLRAGFDGENLDLVAKELRGDPGTPTAPNRFGRGGRPRPRLAPSTTLGARYRLEHQSLAMAASHFDRLGDRRFATVRPVALLDAPLALVTERVAGWSIRDELEPMTRSRLARALAPRVPDRRPTAGDPPGSQPGARIALAGEWLRTYHAMPAEHLPARHADRSEVAAFARALCDFLGDNLRRRTAFRRLGDRLVALTGRVLPAGPPLAVVHGDFAPRNVLVTPDGRVASLDIAAANRAPLYEDLAYFAGSLRMPYGRALSAGLLHDEAAIERLEQRFVRAYFDPAPVPWGAIRLYELLVLLDRWFGTPPRIAAGLPARARRAPAAWLVDRAFDREVEQLLAAAEAHTA